jgi:acyl-coenzyme A thioesterase PaaI-like protein
MSDDAFQDAYPDALAHCYGCGRLNPHGYRLKSRWEGEEAVCRFLPRPEHISVPGYVYGGLLASLIDCHGTGTAAGAAQRSAENSRAGGDPEARFLTASLRVDYLKPTPLGTELEVRARIKEEGARKTVVEEWILAAGVVTVRGEVVAVRVPDSMLQALLGGPHRS